MRGAIRNQRGLFDLTNLFVSLELHEQIIVGGSIDESVSVSDWAAASSDATLVRHQIPASMITGRKYAVSVTMRNTGVTTWTSGGANPFRLGANLDLGTWGSARRELPGPVSPGAEVTFAFEATAPAPGAHRFQWRMLQELIEWFGEPTDVPVQVTTAPVVQGSVGSSSNTSGIGTRQL